MPGAELASRFSTLDWGIVAAYLLVSVVIGLLVRRYVTNMADFVVAGRTLSTWLGLATVIGTEMGLVTVMFAAQMGFIGGFASFNIALILAVMALVVGVTGVVIVPLRKTGVLTIPEFYERRYGPKTRVLGAVILVLSGVLNMGLFLKAGSLFVQGITGLEGTLYLKLIMTALLALVLAYTMLGGMLSVILTDYVQFVMLSLGVFMATGLALSHLGWGAIVETIKAQKGAAGLNPLTAESFGLAYVLFMAFTGFAGATTWQPNVLRACAAKDTRTVKLMFTGGSLGFLIRFLIPMFWGICAFVFITRSPALSGAFFPTDGSAPADSLLAMPVFLSQILPAGILGLMTAAMLAAFMSTHDSYLLSWSSVIVQDIVAPLGGDRLSAKARVWLTRLCIFLIGVFLLIWGLWYDLGQELWNYMAITGSIYFAGAVVVLAGGLYWKRASSAGAVAAMLTGLLSVCALAQVQEALHLQKVKTTWISLGVVVLSGVSMVVFSLLIPDRASDHREEDPQA